MTRDKFDWTDISPSLAVIETIAEAADCDPIKLEPLFETIDPDALDRVMRGNGTDPHERNLTVSFLYNGYEVTVQSKGVVELIQKV